MIGRTRNSLRTYQIPHVHQEVAEKEICRLIQLEVQEEYSQENATWGSSQV